MKKLVLLLLLATAGTAVAYGVTCPLHTYASCYNTGETAPSGAHKYHCSCNDDVWVGR
jgi:hypothetical protein